MLCFIPPTCAAAADGTVEVHMDCEGAGEGGAGAKPGRKSGGTFRPVPSVALTTLVISAVLCFRCAVLVLCSCCAAPRCTVLLSFYLAAPVAS